MTIIQNQLENSERCPDQQIVVTLSTLLSWSRFVELLALDVSLAGDKVIVAFNFDRCDYLQFARCMVSCSKTISESAEHINEPIKYR